MFTRVARGWLRQSTASMRRSPGCAGCPSHPTRQHAAIWIFGRHCPLQLPSRTLNSSQDASPLPGRDTNVDPSDTARKHGAASEAQAAEEVELWIGGGDFRRWCEFQLLSQPFCSRPASSHQDCGRQSAYLPWGLFYFSPARATPRKRAITTSEICCCTALCEFASDHPAANSVSIRSQSSRTGCRGLPLPLVARGTHH
jgi:hypothetical protein